MAERRMFAKTIVDSDAFLDMPQSTQLLYFHLSMRADDDGFINKPKAVMHMVGAKDDDLKLLIVKKFIIPFESGVVVIKHWKIHNFIAKDRYIETKYKNEKAMLDLDENKAYTQHVIPLSTECIQDVNTSDTQVRLGKDRLGEDRLGKVSIGGEEAPPDPPKPSEEEKTAEAYISELPEEIRCVAADWLAYKRERRESYKPQGLKQFMTMLRNRVDKFGADAVDTVIRESMSSGYAGVVWDRLQRNNGAQQQKKSFAEIAAEMDRDGI